MSVIILPSGGMVTAFSISCVTKRERHRTFRKISCIQTLLPTLPTLPLLALSILSALCRRGQQRRAKYLCGHGGHASNDVTSVTSPGEGEEEFPINLLSLLISSRSAVLYSNSTVNNAGGSAGRPRIGVWA